MDELMEFDYNDFSKQLGVLYDFVVNHSGNLDELIRTFSGYTEFFDCLYRGITLEQEEIDESVNKKRINLGYSYSTEINSALAFCKPDYSLNCHSSYQSVLIKSKSVEGIYIPQLAENLMCELEILFNAYSNLSEEEYESYEYIITFKDLKDWEFAINELISLTEKEHEVVVLDGTIEIIDFRFYPSEHIWRLNSNFVINQNCRNVA